MAVKKVGKHLIYSKSNYLINAKYGSNLKENQILALALSKLPDASEDEHGNLLISMTVTEIMDWIKMAKSTAYNTLDPIAQALQKKSIGYTDPVSKEFDYIGLITRCSYKSGVLSLKFNADLKDTLLSTEKKFTKLDLLIMTSFRSNYSFRLYELLKSDQYLLNKNDIENGYEIKFSLAELKLNLGIVDADDIKIRKVLAHKKQPDFEKAVEECTSQKYKSFGELKRSSLLPAIREINNKSDLNVKLIEDKAGKGGKVVNVIFRITPKVPVKETLIKLDINLSKDIDEDDLIDMLRNIIPEIKKTKDLRAILKEAGNDIEKISDLHDYYVSQKNIDNPTGWYIKALKEDYDLNTPKSSKGRYSNNPFNEFPQNDYDFDELEKVLVDN